MKVVRFFPDWNSDTPLWGDDDDDVTPQSLGISRDLQQRISIWVKQWDASFSPNDGWPTSSLREQWMTDGEFLTAALRSELDGASEIVPMFKLYDQVRKPGDPEQ